MFPMQRTSKPNSKPWINPDIKVVLKEKMRIFRSGNTEELKTVARELMKKIREGKNSYRRRMEEKLQQRTPDKDPGAAGPRPSPHCSLHINLASEWTTPSSSSWTDHCPTWRSLEALRGSCSLISPVLSTPYSLLFWGTSWSSQG